MKSNHPITAALLVALVLHLLAGCSGGGGHGAANQPPTVSILGPRDGATCVQGETIPFAGIATDPEEGRLAGSSLVWTATPGGIIGTDESFTRDDLSVGTHTITLTATDSQGASASDSITIEVTARNELPTVTIVSPEDGATYPQGLTIVFYGGATDPEDGDLTGSSLVWTASPGGTIGTGDLVTRDDLPQDTYTITLTATDSQGGSASESITLEVRPPNRLPTVTIYTPTDGAIFYLTCPARFEGGATDFEDGVLTGDSLIWMMGAAWEIGTGTLCVVEDLSVGTYTVTLYGIDLDGGYGSASVTIEVRHTPFVQIFSINATAFPTIEATVMVNTDAALDCGLVEDDFAVDEDGVPQVVDLVTCAASGWIEADIVVVFDDTSSMSDEIEVMKTEATSFADEVLGAGLGARFGLVSFKDTAEVDLPLTDDVAAFQAAVDALQPAGGGDGPEVSLDAVMLALSSMSFRNDACKIFLLITDAQAHYRGDGTSFSSFTMPEVVDALASAGGAVFAVSPDFTAEGTLRLGNDGQAQVMRADRGERDVRILAEETGGIWLDIESADFSVLIDEIVEYLSSLYTVVYTTSNQVVDYLVRYVRIIVADPIEGVGGDCHTYSAPLYGMAVEDRSGIARVSCAP